MGYVFQIGFVWRENEATGKWKGQTLNVQRSTSNFQWCGQGERRFNDGRPSVGRGARSGDRRTTGEIRLRADLEAFEVFAAFHHDGLLFVGLEHEVRTGAGDAGE